MHAFVSSTAVTLFNGKSFRSYPAGTLGAETPVDLLVIDTAGESKALVDHFKQAQDAASAPEGADPAAAPAPAPAAVQFATEAQLLAWPYLPPRLGRLSAKLLDHKHHLHEEPAPLAAQCALLKARKPGQTHFRLVVVNAFGTNLGDTLMGMTAMRAAAQLLGQALGSFTVDFLLGPQANPMNREIVGHDPWVGQALFEGPTLQDFTRYDAYFDFTNLLNLPRFNDLPTMDWYLWWLGLDPAQVDAADKRNRLHIAWSDWRAVAAVLPKTPGTRQVLFNPKASVPLRSCPAEQACQLAEALLALDPALHLVVDQALALEHPRLIDLAGKINSPGKFQALIAQLDGVITVDSFASHVADAAAIPAVLLCTSIPAARFPYYPYTEGMDIPDAAKLPAWGKCKLATDEEWLEMQDQYAAAWARLEAAKVWDALQAKTAERAKAPREPSRIHLVEGPAQFTAVTERAGLQTFRYEQPNPLWSRVHARLGEIAATFLKPGMTAVVAGPGQSALPVALAPLLGALGTLHLFEPRAPRKALVDFDVLRKVPTVQLLSHPAVPIAASGPTLKINATDPLGALDPATWGNLRRQTEVPAQPIDALGLAQCKALLVLRPMPFKQVIEGALHTLAQHSTFLLLGPITQAEAREVVGLLADQGYHFWAESATGDGKMEHLLLLGFPAAQKVNLTGFVRVKM